MSSELQWWGGSWPSACWREWNPWGFAYLARLSMLFCPSTGPSTFERGYLGLTQESWLQDKGRRDWGSYYLWSQGRVWLLNLPFCGNKGFLEE